MKPIEPVVGRTYMIVYMDENVPSYCRYSGPCILKDNLPDSELGYLFEFVSPSKEFPHQKDAYFPWESVVAVIKE